MSHTQPSLSVQDALDDINMELLQDAVQRDDLGQSVQNVRRFQQEARQETLDATGTKPDYRAIANRQFQINDMLLTLLQELATRQRALELDLRVYGGRTVEARSEAGDDDRIPPPGEALVRRLDAIQAVMRDDALALQLEVTPNDTPLVGRVIGNLRAAVHSLVVFYGNQLAAKQTAINRVFGGALQQLTIERAHDYADISTRLQALAAEVAALRGNSGEDSARGEKQQP